jgi:hypothetical protein
VIISETLYIVHEAMKLVGVSRREVMMSNHNKLRNEFTKQQ